ncbi:VOC family protein [Mycobacterium sp. CBMA271]|uniref:VOC family protein n=1 Tax=unclassified Mycobacteroides TaxID=2618759 RepID=UPI0012DCA3AA|nr:MULTISPECIES: VOC family protein [unclassified Mycobacteroides]MUM18559.1 hydroxylase [Mycobacteroides sp. CBMA 326]MUM24595.1 VOC family protein [Mycobacteroides sp. CBMA 271]
MPTREETPLGAPAWIDLSSSDLEKSKAFYGALFGWTLQEAGPEYGGYVNAHKDGKSVAGMIANNPEWNAPDGWTTYFATDDINATLQKVADNGGGNCMQAMEVPQLGYMGIFGDPSGAVVGLWQPLAHKGFQLVAEAGAPVWHELNTREYDKAVDFYTKVLGWDTKVEADSEELRYACAQYDGEPIAGVNDATVGQWTLPEGVPAHWAVYFGTNDTDASAAKVTELGGVVLTPAQDTPYGRMALVQDTTGGTFWLCSVGS